MDNLFIKKEPSISKSFKEGLKDIILREDGKGLIATIGGVTYDVKLKDSNQFDYYPRMN